MGFCSGFILVFLVMGVTRASTYVADETFIIGGGGGEKAARGGECSEIYVVKEGESLHSISDKCKDPFILENNPHIQQHDDVSPGLLIKITNASIIRSRKLLA